MRIPEGERIAAEGMKRLAEDMEPSALVRQV